jgi:hypothetical protein
MRLANDRTDSDFETKNQNQNQLNHDVQQAVTDTASGMLEEIHHQLAEEKADFEKCREVISDIHIDDASIIGISMSDEIDLIEEFADEFGFIIGDVKPDQLRNRIDGIATWIVHYLAQQAAMEAVDALEAYMAEFDLEVANIVLGNSHGWARHFSESEVGEHGWSYNYRNLEHEEIHIDVIKYNNLGLEITFEKYVDAADVTDEEKYFDAT